MKCEDCKHWKLDYNNYGTCRMSEREESITDIEVPNRMLLKCDGADWYTEVYTGKDFGCIWFEEKSK